MKYRSELSNRAIDSCVASGDGGGSQAARSRVPGGAGTKCNIMRQQCMRRDFSAGDKQARLQRLDWATLIDMLHGWLPKECAR